MKTIGRVLIILIVFSIVSGLLVTAVNASGANRPNFGENSQFRPNGDNNRPQAEGNRPERRDEGEGGSGLGMVFGAIKNIVVVGFLVTIIVWPKSVAKKRRKSAVVNRKS